MNTMQLSALRARLLRAHYHYVTETRMIIGATSVSNPSLRLNCDPRKCSRTKGQRSNFASRAADKFIRIYIDFRYAGGDTPIRMRTLCLVHFGGERTAACIPGRTRRLLAANIRVSIYSVCIPVVMRQLLLRAEAEATSWALPACVYLAATLSGAGASGQVPSYVLLSSGPFSAKM